MVTILTASSSVSRLMAKSLEKNEDYELFMIRSENSTFGYCAGFDPVAIIAFSNEMDSLLPSGFNISRLLESIKEAWP